MKLSCEHVLDFLRNFANFAEKEIPSQQKFSGSSESIKSELERHLAKRFRAELGGVERSRGCGADHPNKVNPRPLWLHIILSRRYGVLVSVSASKTCRRKLKSWYHPLLSIRRTMKHFRLLLTTEIHHHSNSITGQAMVSTFLSQPASK